MVVTAVDASHGICIRVIGVRAQQAVVQTRLAQLQSQVTLYKTLGGGWKDEATAAAVLTR